MSTEPHRRVAAQSNDPDDLDAVMIDARARLEEDWRAWLGYFFPAALWAGFAPHHVAFWEWAWGIRMGSAPDPFVAIWPRGGAKSSSAEMAMAALAARCRRNYVLYVCDIQTRADDHVANIAEKLESERLSELYPEVGERLVNKFNVSRGWNRNRLRTASGFTIDAIGLDKATRGAKLGEVRPDLIVFDDIDDGTDSPVITDRKIQQITRTFLPALAHHGATVLAVQNLVLQNGVFARIAGLAEQEADFLQDRVLSGPIPAAYGLKLGKDDEGKDVFLSGEPTWDGQGPEQINAQIRLWSPTGFLIEAQHEVQRRSGGLFNAWAWIPQEKWIRPDEGNDFDPNMPPGSQRCRAWDQAGTEFDGKNDPDWTVGVRWAFHDGLYRIEDVVRFRHSAGTRDEIMAATANADATEFGTDRVAQLVERRPGDLGRDEADRMVREVFAGHRAHKIAPIGTKEDRAAGLASAMENGLVSIVDQEPDPILHRTGTRAFLAEHEGFPLLAHDDQVDAAAHGFNWIRKVGGSEPGTSAAVASARGPMRRR